MRHLAVSSPTRRSGVADSEQIGHSYKAKIDPAAPITS